ncbi:PQQ-binding-like beta-propeller repeat protein [Haloarchaeobius iranensis]|uniref:PQQ-binding-like beta-propeller repeat protein n=1 Tax=Haloarchaeobius iranensis TaxID=996166 RepID=UPI0011140152
MRWQVDLQGRKDGKVQSSRNTLFAAGEQNHLLALDPVTSEQQWTKKFQAGKKVGLAVDQESETICLNDGNGKNVYALDISTGEEVMSFKVEGEITAPVSAAQGNLFVVTDVRKTEEHEFGERTWIDSRVAYAIDIETGETQWTLKLPDSVHARPVIRKDLLLCADIRSRVCAIDIHTGEVRWDTKLRSGFSFSQPPVANQEEIFLVGTNEDENSNQAYALDIESGELQWRYQLPLGFDERPAISDGTLWVPTADRATGEGTVYAIEPTKSTRLLLTGEIQTLDDAMAQFTMSANDTAAGTLKIPADELPYYGRFEGAQFELFLALGEEYEAISGDPQRNSSLITEFEVVDVRQSEENIEMSLEAIDGEQSIVNLTLQKEQLPESISAEDEAWYLGVSLDYDEGETPTDIIPDAVELFDRYVEGPSGDYDSD